MTQVIAMKPACSFCGKPLAEIKKLIAGPGVYICNECVDLCCSILNEESPGWAESKGAKLTAALNEVGQALENLQRASQVFNEGENQCN